MSRKVNKNQSLASNKQAVAPLRGDHSIVKRPVELDHVKVEQVASLCRELGILPPRLYHLPGEKVVETLLKPSETRFELLCAAFQTFCPELEGELEELKPAPRMTPEEARFQHLLDFCHDIGIFDEGREMDMMKIKGELPADDHLRFWLSVLEFTKMMNEPDGPEDHVPEKDWRDLKRFSELVQIYAELDSDADAPVAPTLLSGPLLEHVLSISASERVTPLQTMERELDNQLRELQNFVEQVKEEDEEESSSRAGSEEPPEALVDDTVLTKIRLLQGNVKDLIHSFLAMYDASLKTAVAACKSVSVDPRAELGELLSKASETQESLVDFVRDVRVILERLRALRLTHGSLTPEAAEMMRDNADVLAINVDRPPHPVERPRGAFDDVFGELFDGA